MAEIIGSPAQQAAWRKLTRDMDKLRETPEGTRLVVGLLLGVADSIGMTLVDKLAPVSMMPPNKPALICCQFGIFEVGHLNTARGKIIGGSDARELREPRLFMTLPDAPEGLI